MAPRPAVDQAMAAIEELVTLRRRLATGWLRDCEMSIAQVHLLATLHDAGPTTLGALAVILGIAAPSATGLVDRLVERGLVERLRSEDDRRVVQVSLTAAGRKAAEQMHGLGRQQVRAVLAELDDADLAEVTRLAARLREASTRVAARQAPVPR